MEGFNEVIRLARQRAYALPKDHADHLTTLNQAAMDLGRGYSTTKVIEELDESIRMFREAVNSTAPGDPDRATYLSNLGHALGFKYTATQNMPDLDETLRVLRQALEVTPPNAATLPVCMNNLGMRLGQRYERTKAIEDLNEAISMSRAAILVTPYGDPDRVRRLHNLGNSLNKRYQLSKEPTDLDDAITFLHEAVSISPPGTRERGEWFTNLGNSMTDRYALTREDAHLEEAIKMLRKGIQASPHNPALAVWLNNLGLRLADKYTRSGDMADLEEATEIARRSLQLTSGGDPERINRQMNLANRLCVKHNRTGAIKDLDQGIAILQEVVAQTPTEDSERAPRLNNLGTSYANKYLRTDDKADLDEAIDILRKAVAASKPGKLSRAACLSNLGNNLAYLYARNRSMGVLLEAVEISRQAVDATPTGHHATAERLANLSLRLRDKFLRTGNMTDLNEAVRVSQKSVEATPPEHPVQAACFDTAGIIFLARYRESRKPEDLEAARDYFTKALPVSNTAVSVRVKAGRRFLTLPGIANDPKAYDIARSTIDLIPLLTPRSLQDTDKQHLLSDAVGMASDAAAIALQAGKGAEVAIDILETGRGVIASSSFEQSDVSRLMREHRDLAVSFVDLRDRLDRPAMQDAGSSIRPEAEDIDPVTLVDTERLNRYEAQRKLATLLDEIRSMSGFDRFLLPASIPEMHYAAKYGPIVILNVSSHRCDALIIEQSWIRSIPLRNLSQDAINSHASQLESVDTLKWLWDVIVSPVLDALDFTASSSEWRRIWWIPTGQLTTFPLHAAGDHLARSGKTTLDKVVSSYSASVRTIIHGRRQQYQPSEPGGDSQMDLVAVSMSETVGYAPLGHAESEVKAVLSVLGPSKLQHRQPPGYKKDVLSALDNCKIFHFAGHGRTHPDPLQSTLLLKDWQREPLTVANLLQADFGARPPFLAYLSACGTGQIRNSGSMDESIHLANAFQFAGVRHVVGTLWNVDDELCVRIARDTYEFMCCNGIQDESVSRGLHYATRKQRDEWVKETCTKTVDNKARQEATSDRDAVLVRKSPFLPKSPLWVPYMHFGV
ncbi:hypothetical protein Hte_002992 [Hypoxylon texense]